MKRQRGWCLIEMFVVIIVGSAISTTAAVLVHKQQQDAHLLGDYGQGLRELRAVLSEMGSDVRAGRDLEKAGWKLVDHRVFRGDRVRATHVAALDISQDGAITTIRLSPMSRMSGATDEPTATLTLRVASRGGA